MALGQSHSTRRRAVGALGLVVAAVSSCAPTPSSPASPPAAPIFQQPPSCTSSSAVPIGVGDVAQQIVDGHPAGTTYLIRAGTHLRNFSVVPRSGDHFCGEPGAVLDGGRSLKTAFSGGASGVTLD